MRSYNDSEQRRDDELLQAVFTAVAAGDTIAAQESLLMVANGAASERLAALAAQTRYDLSRPYRAPDLAEPFVLPIAGHEPGMSLAGIKSIPSASR